MKEWYKLSAEETIAELRTNPVQGLNDGEVERRLEEYGHNELEEKGAKSPWLILWEQFTGTMVVILIIAGVISALLGDINDTIAIIAIVILNALLGFRQEYQAERAIEALKKLAVPTVRVRRSGHVQEISSRDLVPGDIVLLEAGNLVPADSRLLESPNLRIQEAALTGESEPVEKDARFVASRDMDLADRRNMAYMGTVVSYGRGEATVTNTGMSTELGSIAELMQTTEAEQTPLQRRLDQLGKSLAIASLGLVAIVFFLGLLRGEEIRLMILTAISMAVAAVPEGLPAVVTIALALGAQRMLQRKALIRKLPAVEALGSVTVICSDKTGTLTENRMTVTVLDIAGHHLDLSEGLHRDLFQARNLPCKEIRQNPQQIDNEQVQLMRKHPALTLLLAGGTLANDALLECEEEHPERIFFVGDPTEGALVVAAVRMGLAKETLESFFPRVAEVPFESERKRMSTVHQMPASASQVPEAFRPIWDWEGWAGKYPYIVFTKGATDSLLNIANRVWTEDHIEPMDEEWRRRIEAANASLAEKGMRVLGVGARGIGELSENGGEEAYERDLVFIGMVGMIDPARPEVRDAVAKSKSAGIRPMMITGDHPLTARTIARDLGLAVNGRVVTGAELEKMSPEELEDTVAKESIYARVSPEHKLRIVEALQRLGQIAAMTGDGVNDAPALKTADIGVAMGITGTDVTKEAADMVLLDDNFATIVAAVEEGRRIYDNIRKFIRYTLTSNAGEIWVMLLGPFLGMPLPLLPIQILWINLVTDGLPGLALAVEPAESNVMKRPPNPPNENIFSRGLARDVLWIGLLMGVVSLGLGFWLWSTGYPRWQTVIFTTLTLSQMGNALAVRSERESLFSIGLLSNRAMLGAVLLTFVLQLLVIYVPFLQRFFETEALSLGYLALSLAFSSIVFFSIELHKWFLRRRSQQPESAS